MSEQGEVSRIFLQITHTVYTVLYACPAGICIVEA